MTNEEKQLLLKDLCARLPYKPQVVYNGVTETLSTLHIFDMTHLKEECVDIKPYLRPMSSMTEEERRDWSGKVLLSKAVFSDKMDVLYDFCNARHLDYRGLIPMDLALPAPEGMYYFI